ncbi:thioesterase family protein [Nocardioides sp. Kera G14]|uniref:thioesterase family protein n=1 Tax=Nocardioides sp. Kera G14 TaxID=2884264 RepID=UPI001D1211BD|nr:thioesterase family protein [Nocardioides sp. Kera G14]UDY22849.1 thioesterase family protein [Nocardioides sp. Kera G14]
MAQYDDDIAVTPTNDPTRLAATLDERWTVGGGLNGGYLLGVVGSAIRTVVPAKPDPITVSAFYLGPGTPGPAEVHTEIKRDGGSLAVVAADLVQEGRTRLSALATYADLGSFEGSVRTTAIEPELPPVEECVSTLDLGEQMRKRAPMYQKFEMRFPKDGLGWAMGQPSGRGEIAGWFRFRDGREPDAFSLITICDLLPPVAFDLGLPGWSPTLELTVHVRAVPAPGWLKLRHASRNLAGGMFEEDCEIWDSAGRLVAQSRQLARTPRGV